MVLSAGRLPLYADVVVLRGRPPWTFPVDFLRWCAMFPGPIFRRELKTAARPRSLFVVRTIIGVALATIMILTGLGVLGRGRMTGRVYEPHELSTFGGVALIALITVEILFLMSVALETVSPSIAEERAKDTLPLLLLTRLSHVEIVLTKLLGRLIPALRLVLVGFPLIAGCAWCAGLPALVVVEVIAVVTSTVIVAGGLSIMASARRDSVVTARASIGMDHRVGWHHPVGHDDTGQRRHTLGRPGGRGSTVVRLDRSLQPRLPGDRQCLVLQSGRPRVQ